QGVLGVHEPGRQLLDEEVSHGPFDELVRRRILEPYVDDALAEIPEEFLDGLRDLVAAARRASRAGPGALREMPMRITLLLAAHGLLGGERCLVGLGADLVEEPVDGVLGFGRDSWGRCPSAESPSRGHARRGPTLGCGQYWRSLAGAVRGLGCAAARAACVERRG